MRFSRRKTAFHFSEDEVRPALHHYPATVGKTADCPILIVNSIKVHVHILHRLSRTMTVAEVVGTFKSSTSQWLRTQVPALDKFFWQGGYGAFSVSESRRASHRTVEPPQDPRPK